MTINSRIKNGKITDQKCWQFIKELNSYSDERLDAFAITDGKREYTYRQMFRQWEKYAEVFSALKITERNGSRVGMLSAPAAVPTMMFYALNMTGASVSMLHRIDVLVPDALEKAIRKEGITDLVLYDTFLQPSILEGILRKQSELGLRNIIVVHDRLDGFLAPEGMREQSRMKCLQLRRMKGVLLMDDLLEQYEATPIIYGSGESRDDAVILHSSGTTSGVHKPIPFSDRAVNEAAFRLLSDKRFNAFEGTAVSALGMDFSGAYSLIDMVHLPFSFGGKVITLPLGLFNPRFPKAIEKYRINILFAGSIWFENWIKMKQDLNLSTLKFVFAGGGYVSAEAKKRYNAFLKKGGCDVGISNGYGLTEIGGACIIAPPDREDDAIGYALSGVKVKIFDEDEEKLYDLADGPRTGGLFLSSPSLSSGKLDDTLFFELEEIDGEKYLNTYDLVTVNEDGSLTCIGRMNKYFVNNDGIRFDAGLVETAVAAQPGIVSCGLAPEMDKVIHDTVPVLYVEVDGTGKKAESILRQALINVFIRDNKIKETNLPGWCVITDHIPLTDTGKVDVPAIAKGGVKGTRIDVKPVRRNRSLVDIRLVKARAGGPSFAGIPDELEETVGPYMKYIMANRSAPGTFGQQSPAQGFGCQGMSPCGFGCQQKKPHSFD